MTFQKPLVERVAPAGERIARAIGAIVIGTGLLLSARTARLRPRIRQLGHTENRTAVAIGFIGFVRRADEKCSRKTGVTTCIVCSNALSMASPRAGHCSRAGAGVVRSFVPVARPAPVRDDEQSPQDAPSDVRTDYQPRSPAVRRKSAGGNRRGHSGSGGRGRSPPHDVPAMEDRSVFADSGCGCGRILSHRVGRRRSCRGGLRQSAVYRPRARDSQWQARTEQA